MGKIHIEAIWLFSVLFGQQTLQTHHVTPNIERDPRSTQNHPVSLCLRGGSMLYRIRDAEFVACRPDRIHEPSDNKQKLYDVGFLPNGPTKPMARRSASYCDYTRLLHDNQNASIHVKFANSCNAGPVDVSQEKVSQVKLKFCSLPFVKVRTRTKRSMTLLDMNYHKHVSKPSDPLCSDGENQGCQWSDVTASSSAVAVKTPVEDREQTQPSIDLLDNTTSVEQNGCGIRGNFEEEVIVQLDGLQQYSRPKQSWDTKILDDAHEESDVIVECRVSPKVKSQEVETSNIGSFVHSTQIHHFSPEDDWSDFHHHEEEVARMQEEGMETGKVQDPAVKSLHVCHVCRKKISGCTWIMAGNEPHCSIQCASVSAHMAIEDIEAQDGKMEGASVSALFSSVDAEARLSNSFS
uniref:Uncharacterized protein n=1 Tax=Guillardia theta TaxID=55529 RepID=A0A7S4KLE3_GUITH|mmetsp:Transcript_26807/g.87776  ORF Transcript_26807/g.87776 Transcript_26807/m.87776 type:complete len:407 (+) Transcript_26807:293-1513(+)